MKKTTLFSNRLDDSTGIGQDNPNETMQNASQTKKTPWRLRFAGALNLKEIAATTGIGTIYGLLFAGLLFAPLLPHLAAQTSSTNPVAVQTPAPQPTQAGGPGLRRAIIAPDGITYSFTSSTELIPNGAQVQGIWKILPIVERIGRKIPWRTWLGGIGGGAVGSVAGNAIWDELTKTWTLPPGAVTNGRIQAIAIIDTWKIDGEKTHWYSKGGEWAWQKQWGFNLKDADDELNTKDAPSSDNQNRDYHYYDYSCTQLVWDDFHERWTSKLAFDHRHIYGHTEYNPDKINTYRNDGDTGAYWPEHDWYDKGKKDGSSGLATM